jgi:hypothetical protein
MRRFLDWMIRFIDTLYTVLRTTDNYSAIADLHTLQSTVIHALGFSVFTSRILATDLQQSHCHFKVHKKSSLHPLIPFLPLFCNCQLSSIPLLRCSYPSRLASRYSTWLNSTQLDYILSCWTLLYNHLAENTASIVKEVCLLTRCLAVDVLLWCAFASARICLPSPCLAMGMHVTVSFRRPRLNTRKI